MIKRIPKKFRLGAHVWTVLQVSAEEMQKNHADNDTETLYGVCYPDELTIYVRKAGKGFKRAVVLETFMHELMHAVLWTAGHKDWDREHVVTTTSHLLLSYTELKE